MPRAPKDMLAFDGGSADTDQQMTYRPSVALLEALGLARDAEPAVAADRLRQLAGLPGPSSDPATWLALAAELDGRIAQPLAEQPRDMGEFAFFIAYRALHDSREADMPARFAREISAAEDIDVLDWLAAFVTETVGPLLHRAGVIAALPYA